VFVSIEATFYNKFPILKSATAQKLSSLYLYKIPVKCCISKTALLVRTVKNLVCYARSLTLCYVLVIHFYLTMHVIMKQFQKAFFSTAISKTYCIFNKFLVLVESAPQIQLCR